MVCASVKEGQDCFFMSKSGCRFNGGSCHTIVEQCDGCQRVKGFSTGEFCLNFPDPAAKWRVGQCTMATHVKMGNGTAASVKVNPLKASKRTAR